MVIVFCTCLTHLYIVIGTGDFWMVLNVKSVIKFQTDQKSILKLNVVCAVSALGVGVWEIYTREYSCLLTEQAVSALNCKNRRVFNTLQNTLLKKYKYTTNNRSRQIKMHNTQESALSCTGT